MSLPFLGWSAAGLGFSELKQFNHLHINGQSEYIIQAIKDIHTCILDFGGNWVEHIYLFEFPYHNLMQMV